MKKILLFTSILFLTISTSLFAQHPTNLVTSNITSSSVDLSWDASACVTSVNLKYREVGAGSWNPNVNNATSPYLLSGLLANTSYEWTVKCAFVPGWQTTEVFTTLSSPSVGPTISNVSITSPILCFGGTADIQIDVAQTSPATSYKCVIGNMFGTFFASYVSTNISSANSLSLGNLPAGDYVVRVVDSIPYYTANPFGNGTSSAGVYDEYSTVISITEPPQIVAVTTSNISNMCAGDCLAEEQLNISGGTMPYSFIVNNGVMQTLANGLTAQSFVALCAGSYDIVVTDSNGCATIPPTTTFTIAPIAPIVPNGSITSFFNLNGEHISCNGESDGEITASATGGTGIFTYSLDSVNFQSSAVFSGLSAGVYTVYYKDANDCVATEQFTLVEPPVLSGTVAVSQPVNCFGVCDGELIFTVDTIQIGTPPYQYSIDAGATYQASSTFSSLCGDTSYSVMVEDGNGCQYTSVIYLAEPNQILYSSVLSDYNGFEVSCNGLNDGSILINTPVGGVAPYQFALNSGTFGANNNFLNLDAGQDTVLVQDSNGCIDTTIFNMVEPGIFTLTPIITNIITCPEVCDGSVSVTALNAVATTSYLITNGTVQSTTFWSGLCGSISFGNYSIDATDANGCTATTSFSIAEPTPFVYTVDSVVEYCSSSDGEASIAISSGGTGGYTYDWNDANSQQTATAFNLVANTYTVTVTDGNNCSFTEDVEVGSNAGFTLSFDSISPCLGGTNGSATVYPTGIAPFVYSWNTGESTQTINNLPIGIYTVQVTDATNCTVSASVEIAPASNALSIDSLIINEITCFGANNASIQILASGGQKIDPDGIPNNGDEHYWYSNDNGNSTQAFIGFANLSPNTYIMMVEDANGCYGRDTVVIANPQLLQIDSTIHTNVSCFGADNAAIQGINVLGGTAPFEYSVNGSTHYTNMAYFNNYGPGTYTVEVFDANNCSASDLITIDEPDILEVTITTSGWVYNPNSNSYSYQIKCNGDNSGFANIAITGGTAPFMKNCYDNNGVLISSSTNPSITGLTAGVYTFEVIDANNCTYTEVITYNEPSPITHNFIPTHVTCNAWNNGSLTDIVSGGVGDATSYIYAWDTGDSTYTITGIPVGTYTMTVVDDNNCTSVASFYINDNNALSASASGQDVSCFDYCDGVITTNPVGGMPNFDINGNPVYTYQWDDVLLQTTQNAIGLCVDNLTNTTTYSCVITDGQGCDVTVSAVINQPDELIVSSSIISNYNLQDISCYGENDGIASASVVGGNSPFDFTWSTGMTQNNVLVSTINNLAAGTYTVVVSDNEGCMDTTAITLSQPSEVTLSVSQTNVNCYGIFDGSITADADGGTPINGIPPMYNYVFSNNFNEQIDISTATDLSPGIYTVTATDDNGCSIDSESIFISQPSDFLTITLDSINETCALNDGEVIAFVLGGTQPYNYDWSNGMSGNIPSLNSLAPNNYSVVVTDANNCVISDETRVIGVQEVFLPGNRALIDTSICLGASVYLPIDIKPNFIYTWTYNNDTIYRANSNNYTDITVAPSIAGLNDYILTINEPGCMPYQVLASISVEAVNPLPSTDPLPENGGYVTIVKNESVDILSNNMNCDTYEWSWGVDNILNTRTITDKPETSGWYYIAVDSAGCLGFDSIYVVVGVKPYDAITPNGDGFNDVWNILDIASYPNAVVQVFNRWGALVHETLGGLDYAPWDGTRNGKELPVGTYYYIIDLKTDDDPQSGPITIIR